jgi:DNA topoisomerase VI subunit A
METEEIQGNWSQDTALPKIQPCGLGKVTLGDLRVAGRFYWTLYMNHEDADINNYQDSQFMDQKIRGLAKHLVKSIFTNDGQPLPKTNLHEFHTFDYELWGWTHRTKPATTLDRKDRKDHCTLRKNLDRLTGWLIILQEIVSASASNQVLLKRQLFYKHIDQFSSQGHSDKTIQEIAYYLKVPRYSLKIEATGKGLVASKTLELFMLNDPSQNFNIGFMTEVQGGFVIKNALNLGVTNLENVNFVLIVEKETVYSELIESGYFQDQFFSNSILITGKGYPDFNTKYLLRKIFERRPETPFFYLGDGDPHGYDIFLSYLFGSQKSAYDHTYLPVIWQIGVDISDFWGADWKNAVVGQLEKLELTDGWKIMEMLQIEYFWESNLAENIGVGENWDCSREVFLRCQVVKLERVKNNLRAVLEIGRKAEVESVKFLGVSLLQYAKVKISQVL